MKRKATILILILIITFPLVVNARYFEKIENIKGKAIIAEPIFKVETLQDTIIQTIDKETNIKQYVFKIKNYETENNGTSKRINQVDMLYNIEIINEKENFPIKIALYEIDSTENLLKENKKTEEFLINKNIEYEKVFKVVVSWDEKNDILDINDNIKIIINSTQKK